MQEEPVSQPTLRWDEHSPRPCTSHPTRSFQSQETQPSCRHTDTSAAFPDWDPPACSHLRRDQRCSSLPPYPANTQTKPQCPLPSSPSLPNLPPLLRAAPARPWHCSLPSLVGLAVWQRAGQEGQLPAWARPCAAQLVPRVAAPCALRDQLWECKSALPPPQQPLTR